MKCHNGELMKSNVYKIAFALLAILCFSGCSIFKNNDTEEDQVGRNEYKPEENVVDTMVLRKTTFMSQLVSNGKLRSRIKSSLRFPIQGVVAKVNVRNGDIVKAGDIIAVLDKRDAENKLQLAKVAFDKAEISLRDGLIGFGYLDPESDDIPEEIERTAKTKLGYEDAKLNMKAAEIELENCTLRAPISGKIADLDTKQHEYTPTGDFCKVLDNNVFEVEFPILETEINQVRTGQKVQVSTFSEPDKRFSGTITEINPMIDDKGQITVKAEFQNPGKFLDGMNVKIFVENGIPDKLVVPKSAVLIRDNLEVLFLVKDNKAAWTYVNVLMTNSNSCVVVANQERGAELKEGDIVITSGNLNLADGSSVIIK